jgi:hypothetical protein
MFPISARLWEAEMKARQRRCIALALAMLSGLCALGAL